MPVQIDSERESRNETSIISPGIVEWKIGMSCESKYILLIIKNVSNLIKIVSNWRDKTILQISYFRGLDRL